MSGRLHRLGRNRGALALLIAALALLVNVAVVRQLPEPTFLKYPVAAEQWQDGTLGRERLVDFSPLYLGLHLAARGLPGPEAAVHVLQVALASLAAALAFVLLAGRLSPRLAVAGAALFVFDRQLLVYTHVLEPELLLVTLLLVLLVLVDERRPPRLLVAGLVAGLALATRPTLLPVVLAVPFHLLLRDRGETPAPRLARRIGAFLLPVAGALAVLVACGVRAGGDWRTPVMNPGTVFFEGNNPLSHGTSAVYPPLVRALNLQPTEEPDAAHRFYREVARGASGEALSIRQVNAYWQGLAVGFLADEPGLALRRLGGKLANAFNQGRLHDVASAWLYDRALRLPSTPFAVLAALALVGLLAEARRWRGSLLLYVLTFSQLAVMLAFYVSSRQRLTILPGLVYFAAVGLERLGRGRSRLLVALVVLLALSLLPPTHELREEDYALHGELALHNVFEELRPRFADEPPAWHTATVAAALAHAAWRFDDMRPSFVSQEEAPLIERLYAKVPAATDPRPEARFDRALVAFRTGRLEEAADLLRALAAEGYAPYRQGLAPTVEVYRGHVALAGGARDAAVAAYRRALLEAPGEPRALAALAVLTGEARYRRRLERYWSALDADYQLGRAYLRQGDGARAAAHLERVVTALPELREAKIYLAAALAATGRLEAGARYYLQAVEISLDPVLLDPEIPDLFRAWAAADRRPSVQLAAARVLHQYGYLRQALALVAPLEAEMTAPPPPAPIVARARAVAADLRRALAPPAP